MLSNNVFAVGYSKVVEEKESPIYHWKETQKVKIEKLVFKGSNKEENKRLEKMLRQDAVFGFCSKEDEYLQDSLSDLESECEISKKSLTKDTLEVEAVCEEHSIKAKLVKKDKNSYVGTNKIYSDNDKFLIKASSKIEVKKDGLCD